MKKINLFTSLLFVASVGFAQVEVNSTTGNMAVGTVPNAKAKLLLKQSKAATDTLFGFHSTITNTNASLTQPLYGSYSQNTNNGYDGNLYGMYQKNISNNSTRGTVYGIYLENTTNSGSGSVMGLYTRNITNSFSATYGINSHTTSTSSSAGTIYGLYSRNETNSLNNTVYGVYSWVSGGNDNNRYSGYFTGGKVSIVNDLYIKGLYVNNVQIYSDERLKSDIKLLSTEKDKLYQLQGKSYKKTVVVVESRDSLSIALRAENKQEVFDDISEFGYLAQELKEVFPELVSQDSTTGYYSVNYIGLIPVIIEALKDQQEQIKEQQKTNESQQREIETLKRALAGTSLKSAEIGDASTNSATTSEAMQNMYLSDNAAIEGLKLYQNAPNPFNERTTVKCYVPQNIQKVQLCVYNMQGVQVQCITITERGNVSIEIEAGALSAGIYSYVLLADGAASETKQMILTR